LRILITGSTGRLGRELLRVFPESYAPSRLEMDIRLRDRVHQYIARVRPDVIIHTAALTGIRQCEDDKILAWSTNVTGTENLVNSVLQFSPNAYLIFVSTACVFYGDRGGYTEDDVPNPKNYYALTKLIAETAVRNAHISHWLIIRTNFAAREKWPYQRAFVDRFGTYLFADDLAQAIKSLIPRSLEGIIHVCGDKRISMLELARLTNPKVQGMTMNDYAGPPLTIDMSLASKKIERFRLCNESPEIVHQVSL